MPRHVGTDLAALWHCRYEKSIQPTWQFFLTAHSHFLIRTRSLSQVVEAEEEEDTMAVDNPPPAVDVSLPILQLGQIA